MGNSNGGQKPAQREKSPPHGTSNTVQSEEYFNEAEFHVTYRNGLPAGTCRWTYQSKTSTITSATCSWKNSTFLGIETEPSLEIKRYGTKLESDFYDFEKHSGETKIVQDALAKLKGYKNVMKDDGFVKNLDSYFKNVETKIVDQSLNSIASHLTGTLKQVASGMPDVSDEESHTVAETVKPLEKQPPLNFVPQLRKQETSILKDFVPSDSKAMNADDDLDKPQFWETTTNTDGRFLQPELEAGAQKGEADRDLKELSIAHSQGNIIDAAKSLEKEGTYGWDYGEPSISKGESVNTVSNATVESGPSSGTSTTGPDSQNESELRKRAKDALNTLNEMNNSKATKQPISYTERVKKHKRKKTEKNEKLVEMAERLKQEKAARQTAAKKEEEQELARLQAKAEAQKAYAQGVQAKRALYFEKRREKIQGEPSNDTPKQTNTRKRKAKRIQREAKRIVSRRNSTSDMNPVAEQAFKCKVKYSKWEKSHWGTLTINATKANVSISFKPDDANKFVESKQINKMQVDLDNELWFGFRSNSKHLADLQWTYTFKMKRAEIKKDEKGNIIPPEEIKVRFRRNTDDADYNPKYLDAAQELVEMLPKRGTGSHGAKQVQTAIRIFKKSKVSERRPKANSQRRRRRHSEGDLESVKQSIAGDTVPKSDSH